MPASIQGLLPAQLLALVQATLQALLQPPLLALVQATIRALLQPQLLALVEGEIVAKNSGPFTAASLSSGAGWITFTFTMKGLHCSKRTIDIRTGHLLVINKTIIIQVQIPADGIFGAEVCAFGAPAPKHTFFGIVHFKHTHTRHPKTVLVAYIVQVYASWGATPKPHFFWYCVFQTHPY